MQTQKVIDYFKSKYGQDAAYGIAANLAQESGGGLNNPSTLSAYKLNKSPLETSYGLAQWNSKGSPDRYTTFQKLYGKPLTSASEDEQLAYIDYELQHGYKGTINKMINAGSGSEAAKIFSREYERPQNVQGEQTLRAKIANKLQILAGKMPSNAGSQLDAIVNNTVTDTPKTPATDGKSVFDKTDTSFLDSINPLSGMDKYWKSGVLIVGGLLLVMAGGYIGGSKTVTGMIKTPKLPK